MPDGLSIVLNGQSRNLPQLGLTNYLSEVVLALELKSDRIAIELNGEIAPRTTWETIKVSTGDKLEIVHFVGGGAWLGCGGDCL